METIRFAASSDLHIKGTFKDHTNGLYIEMLQEISKIADAIVLCGDITEHGTQEEAKLAAYILRNHTVPLFYLLGNHDHYAGDESIFHHILKNEAGAINIVEGNHKVSKGERNVGLTGVEGFYGGFYRRNKRKHKKKAKNRIQETPIFDQNPKLTSEVERLAENLKYLSEPFNLVALHYSPIISTLIGEKPHTYPFLGSSELETIIDKYRDNVTSVVHGHAHNGNALGKTLGGVDVFNVSVDVLRTLKDSKKPSLYRVLEF